METLKVHVEWLQEFNDQVQVQTNCQALPLGQVWKSHELLRTFLLGTRDDQSVLHRLQGMPGKALLQLVGFTQLLYSRSD